MALRDALPEPLRPVVSFAYHTGWRVSEILALTWDKIDLREGIARLNAGETKNGEGRTVFLNEELWAILHALHSQRRLGCPWVFHREGRRIKNFHDSWLKACKLTGLEGKLFHDFRRTAVRNLVRAGVPERVCMAISGHKTRSVFERYNIVSEGDLREAARRQQAFLVSQKSHNSSHNAPFSPPSPQKAILANHRLS